MIVSSFLRPIRGTLPPLFESIANGEARKGGGGGGEKKKDNDSFLTHSLFTTDGFCSVDLRTLSKQEK